MDDEATQRFDRLTAGLRRAGEDLTSVPHAEMPTNTLQAGRCGARNRKGDPCAAPALEGAALCLAHSGQTRLDSAKGAQRSAEVRRAKAEARRETKPFAKGATRQRFRRAQRPGVGLHDRGLVPPQRAYAARDPQRRGVPEPLTQGVDGVRMGELQLVPCGCDIAPDSFDFGPDGALRGRRRSFTTGPVLAERAGAQPRASPRFRARRVGCRRGTPTD